MSGGVNSQAVWGHPLSDEITAVTARPVREGIPTSIPPGTRGTAAHRALWAALIARPGANAAELAATAGISYPYAVKTLRALERIGRAEADGVRRRGYRWQACIQREAGPPLPMRREQAELITYPFPLSSGPMCYLILPVRLTAADAKRLTACLRSLVMDDDRAPS